MRVASLNQRSYQISLIEAVSCLTEKMADYLAFRFRYKNHWNREEWKRDFNPVPITQVILDHVFEEHVGGEKNSLLDNGLPLFREWGISPDVAHPILLEVMNLIIFSLGALFPNLKFGDGVRIHYDITSGYDLWIGVSDWLE